jgi:hypothetical protein
MCLDILELYTVSKNLHLVIDASEVVKQPLMVLVGKIAGPVPAFPIDDGKSRGSLLRRIEIP